MLRLEKVSDDARGEIHVLKEGNKEIANFDGFRQGAPRGGHYHASPESKTVVYGELEYWRVRPEDITSEIKSIVKRGETIKIEPNVAHLFVAMTDALLFGIRDGNFEATIYAPYRKIVENYMRR